MRGLLLEDEFVVAGDGEAVFVAGVADEEDFGALEELCGVDGSDGWLDGRAVVGGSWIVGWIAHVYCDEGGGTVASTIRGRGQGRKNAENVD